MRELYIKNTSEGEVVIEQCGKPIITLPRGEKALYVTHTWEEYDQEQKRISQLESDSAKYHKIMSLLKDTQLPHGLCQPRSRRACTCCNAKEEIDKMMINYKGRIIWSHQQEEKK